MSSIDPGRPRPSTPRSPRRRWSAWRARFARAFCRFLRFTTGLYVSLLLAFSALAQDPPDSRERVRFIDGKAELCEALSADETGVTLRLERLPKPVVFEWWQLDPASAAALRKRFLGGVPAAAPPGAVTVAGLRLRTSEGKEYEGILLAGSPAGELWIKNSDGKWIVPLDKVTSREEIALPVARVYGVDELLTLMTGVQRPKTAEEADRLGTELLRAKLQDRAMAAFRLAEILRHPERTESVLYSELSRLRERVETLAVRKSVYQAQESYLLGDYDGVLLQIDQAEKAAGLPDGVAGELRRLRAQIQDFRGLARDERIVQEGYRTIEMMLKVRAMDRAVSYETARAHVEGPLADEVFESLRRRLNFSPEDPSLKRAWEARSGAAHKHSYEAGSWLALRPDARAPKTWWEAADDAARYAVLKGLFIEKRLQVLRSDLKACPACGGAGTVSTGALCSSCLGVKSHRVLIYR